MKFIFSLILLCFISVNFAQKKDGSSFGLGVSMRKIDYFLDVNYQYRFHQLEWHSGVEFGIVKTFFQQRILPGIHLGLSYILFEFPRFQLSPMVDLHYSVLQFNKLTHHYNFWQEYLLGYRLTYGGKWRLVQSAGIGPVLESYRSAYNQQLKTTIGLGYSFQIGVSYAL